MIVETMKPEDLEAVLAIDLASFEGHELGVRDGEDLRARREGQLREELARGWSNLRVAREGDAVVGYLLAWKVVDEFHLLNVAVLPERRRAGIGLRLVEDLLARAPAEGVNRVLLEVRASNVAALALYERLGFERFNLRAGYYADGEDAIEMDRRL